MVVRVAGRMDWLYGLQLNGIKLGLDNITELLRRMGDPHRGIPCIHIAGSDGKGSIAAAVASILTEQGLKVGLYTSPHISDFRERIRVDGVPIPEKDLDHVLGKVRHYAEDMKESGMMCTFFEASTAQAFEYFRGCAVDIAVLEVGMGGRMDATNVVVPIVSVISGISLEHTGYLGNTIREIAGEKAGIIKPGVPVVTYNSGDALEVIRERCAETGSPLYAVNPAQVTDIVLEKKGTRFRFRGRDRYISVPGTYEAIDAQMAISALEICRPETAPFFDRGLSRVHWPCRMEECREGIVVDVSHTVAGIGGMVRDFGEIYGKAVVVFGMLSDKDVDGACRLISTIASEVIVTAPDTERANPADDTLRRMRVFFPDAAYAPSVAEAMDIAAGRAADGRTVLVTGSFHMAEEALAWLNRGQ